MTFPRYAASLLLMALAGCAAPPSSQTVQSFPPAPAGLDVKLSTYLETSKGHPQNVWRARLEQFFNTYK